MNYRPLAVCRVSSRVAGNGKALHGGESRGSCPGPRIIFPGSRSGSATRLVQCAHSSRRFLGHRWCAHTPECGNATSTARSLCGCERPYEVGYDDHPNPMFQMIYGCPGTRFSCRRLRWNQNAYKSVSRMWKRSRTARSRNESSWKARSQRIM